MGFFIKNKEEILIKRLRDGQNGAMQDFYSQYGDYLTAVCARYITDDDDLKDVLQDSMITIFTHIKQFEYRGKGSLLAWSARICANQALNFIKQNNRQEFVKLDWDSHADIVDEEIPTLQNIPPDVIQQFIRQLPTGYRTIFNLYVLEDKSHDEIAKLLGIKRNTSASQLYRAKALLAKKIKEYLSTNNEQQ